MSAYLASNKSLSVIAGLIEHFANRKDQFGTNGLWKVLDKYHNYFLTEASYGETEAHLAEKLFYKLVEINMPSLLERYDDADKEWGTSARSYTYDPSAPVVGIPIVIDLLDNWQYQSCEGVAVETDFYKLTEAIQNKLAREYVRQTRPYEDTVWRIDDYSELDRVKGAFEH